MLKTHRVSIRLFSAILTILLTRGALAQGADPRIGRLNEYVDGLEAYGLSGQILIAEKGKTLLERGYGTAERKRGVRAGTGTIFGIGSLSKQFTAEAILRLSIDGKLDTNDRIGRHLVGVPVDKSPITIAQLLTHTSGMRRDVVQSGDTAAVKRDALVAKILASNLRTAPGAGFAYSNAGYQLLAAIVEAASGQTYGEYLREHVFVPALITRTGVYQDSRWQIEDVAHGYNEWKETGTFSKLRRGWNQTGNGSVVSTAGDLHRWFEALRGGKILPGDVFTQMTVPHTPTDEQEVSYGYGWFVKTTKSGQQLVEHGGDMEGYHCEFRWYPDQEVLLIILTNQDIFGIDGGAVQKRIMSDNVMHILAKEDFPKPPPAVNLPRATLEKYAASFIIPSSGAKVKVWEDAGHLVLGAEGQEVVNQFFPPEGDLARVSADLNRRAASIVEGLSRQDDSLIQPMVSAGEFKSMIPFLKDEYKSMVGRLGPLKGYSIAGTRPLPWDRSTLRTYVNVRFRDGASDFFIGWNKGAMVDVTTEEGRPYPVIVPIAPQSATVFSSFDPITTTSVPVVFRFDSEGRLRGIEIKGISASVEPDETLKPR